MAPSTNPYSPDAVSVRYERGAAAYLIVGFVPDPETSTTPQALVEARVEVNLTSNPDADRLESGVLPLSCFGQRVEFAYTGVGTDDFKEAFVGTRIANHQVTMRIVGPGTSGEIEEAVRNISAGLGWPCAADA